MIKNTKFEVNVATLSYNPVTERQRSKYPRNYLLSRHRIDSIYTISSRLFVKAKFQYAS